MKYLLFLLLVLGCATNKTQKISALKPHTHEIVINSLPELISNHQFDSDDVGFVLLDELGRVEISHNADQLFIPASTNKLFTAAAVVDAFKGHEQFATELRYEGILRQNEGLLDGNLYLVGGGDSTFNSHGMMNLLLALRRLGIKKVLGEFYFDDYALPRIERIESSQDHTFPYNSGVSALSYDFNQMSLFWNQDNDLLSYYFRPSLPSEQQIILGEVVINDDGNINYKDKTWVVSTDTNGKSSVRLPFKDTGMMSALALQKMASDLGIELPYPTRRKVSKQTKLITNHMSPTINKQIKDMLLFSNNVMAESHLLLSSKKHGRVNDLRSAVEVQKKRFARIGLKVEGMHPINGSGLAAASRFSPNSLIEITRYLYKKTKGQILGQLPISGRDGTLRRRMTNPESAYKVWAKTGTMNYASCLAGYFLHNGQIKQFALMINDLEKRKVLDAEFDPIKKAQLLSVTGRWIRRARNFQDDIFLHLVMNPNFN